MSQTAGIGVVLPICAGVLAVLLLGRHWLIAGKLAIGFGLCLAVTYAFQAYAVKLGAVTFHPSGHVSMATFTFSAIACLLIGRAAMRPWLNALIVVVLGVEFGYARLHMSTHSSWDVVAGICIAAISLLLVARPSGWRLLNRADRVMVAAAACVMFSVAVTHGYLLDRLLRTLF